MDEEMVLDLGVGGGFKGAKNDLIAELKLSHNFGGISKLRKEQQKIKEAQEKEQYQRFLAKFTMENFLEKIPEVDPSGAEIPMWKREMMAKKAAEKAKGDAIEKRSQFEEMKKVAAIPEWKRSLMEKRAEDPERVVATPPPARPKTDIDNLVRGFQTKIEISKENNESGNNLENEPKSGTETLKEVIKKFSVSTPNTDLIQPKFNGKQYSKTSDRQNSHVAQASVITLNENGKEEFCISFDQESEKASKVIQMMKKSTPEKPPRTKSNAQADFAPPKSDLVKISHYEKLSEDEIALRFKNKVQSPSNLVAVDSYEAQPSIGRLDTDSQELNPVKEKLEEIFSTRQSLNGIATLIKKDSGINGKEDTTDGSAEVISFDTSRGSITVDKTSKTNGSIDSQADEPNENDEDSNELDEPEIRVDPPVAATRISIKRKNENFVSVPRTTGSKPVVSVTCFDESKTDYSNVVKPNLN